MSLGLIFDVVLIAILVLSVYFSVKNGLINASKRILSIVLTILIMASSHAYISSWFKTSQWGEQIGQKVSEMLSEQYSQNMTKVSTENTVPPIFQIFISDEVKQMNAAKDNFINSVTQKITDSILSIVALILLYIAIRVFLFILFKILNLIFDLPLLRSVNKLSGALIGVINGLFIVYLLTGILVLFISGDLALTIQEGIGQSYITRYFYNNNLLIQMFLK